MSTLYCGCDPTHTPEPWYCELHRGQGEGGFCPCTEGEPCPDKVTPPAPSAYKPIPGTLVFGLGHKARHGKDSAAQILIEQFPQLVKRFALADALRCYCRVEHGMTVKDAPLLQKVGVAMRQRNPNVWIDTLYWQLVENAPRIAVITDVRFQNEADFVKALGGKLIRVTRLINDEGDPYQATDRDPNHVSETELNAYPWDYEIRARDMKQLHDQVLGYFYPAIRASVLGIAGEPLHV